MGQSCESATYTRDIADNLIEGRVRRDAKVAEHREVGHGHDHVISQRLGGILKKIGEGDLGVKRVV